MSDSDSDDFENQCYQRLRKQKEEERKAFDVTMSLQIMLGMIEGLHFHDEVDRAHHDMQDASDWRTKLDRTKQFETIYEYFVKGLEQDPMDKTYHRWESRESIQARIDMMTPEEKAEFDKPENYVSENVREEQKLLEAKLSPGYVEAAVSRVALEFNWLATQALIDFDKTGDFFQNLPEELLDACKAAHKKLFMPTYEQETRTVKKQLDEGKSKILFVMRMDLNGSDIIKDVWAICVDYEQGRDLYVAGDKAGATHAWRKLGHRFAHLAKERQGSKQRTFDEHGEEIAVSSSSDSE